MEVKLDKRYPVAATLEQAWAVLSDIYATAACMPGAQITEQIDATHFKGTVRSKVGPAVMSFNGDIELQGLDAAAKELKMLGKGADKSGSSASMQLTAHLEPAAEGDTSGGCVLAGVATIIVSGKLAQFGSRLLVPVSDAMLAQFADNFRAAALAVNAAPPAEESTEIRMVQAAEAPGAMPVALPESAVLAATATTAAPAPAPVAAPRPPMPRPPAAPVKELNALALMWTVIKGWFAGLFGKKS
jgi:carbon monoxide dehydrogenase subunit G